MDEGLESVFDDLKRCCTEISTMIRHGNSSESSMIVRNNISDDDVKKLDVESNELFKTFMINNKKF